MYYSLTTCCMKYLPQHVQSICLIKFFVSMSGHLQCLLKTSQCMCICIRFHVNTSNRKQAPVFCVFKTLVPRQTTSKKLKFQKAYAKKSQQDSRLAPLKTTLFIIKNFQHFITYFCHYNILTKTHSRKTGAIIFSCQNATDLRASSTYYGEIYLQ